MWRQVGLICALACAGAAAASPNTPLSLTLEPLPNPSYTAQRRVQTLTLWLKNSSAAPISLVCRSVGAPLLKGGRGQGERLGQLTPQGQAPVCRRPGEVIILAAGARYSYTKTLGVLPAGQFVYRSGWNVSASPGSGWLQGNSAVIVVVAGTHPIPTPRREAYLAALKASGAQADAVGYGGPRLIFHCAMTCLTVSSCKNWSGVGWTLARWTLT
ncbi:hypothetical protein [Deinococcus sp. QL22]|uniref:hypothetical protein n=1 Tax=Deinococcus sp. QL22 TaxID=2939437 RepID=UPI002018321C|nr:hypothetical protein [Deinococcus sp. QL22]UQN06573.1 hypothetical protein M1R55_01235 [Deinococcus sp. QL22]